MRLWCPDETYQIGIPLSLLLNLKEVLVVGIFQIKDMDSMERKETGIMSKNGVKLESALVHLFRVTSISLPVPPRAGWGSADWRVCLAGGKLAHFFFFQ